MKKLLTVACLLCCISLNAQNSVGTHLQQGEVVFHLKQVNIGLQKVSVATPRPNQPTPPQGSLTVEPNGDLVASDPSKLTDSLYIMEVKAECEDSTGSVIYLNTISLKAAHGKLTTSIVSNKIEMAGGWKKDGKIYVVIAVSLVLFFTIILFLIFMNRKLNRIQKSEHR